MEMKEYLSRIRQRILKDGAENTLKMIREQKIGGPSASEIFGDIDYMGLSKSTGERNGP